MKSKYNKKSSLLNCVLKSMAQREATKIKHQLMLEQLIAMIEQFARKAYPPNQWQSEFYEKLYDILPDGRRHVLQPLARANNGITEDFTPEEIRVELLSKMRSIRIHREANPSSEVLVKAVDVFNLFNTQENPINLLFTNLVVGQQYSDISSETESSDLSLLSIGSQSNSGPHSPSN